MNTQSYFAIPKALETNPKYENLSIEARYLYGHMRDILKLSIKNKWQDERGFYIRMARVKISVLLKRSLPTVRRIIAELVTAGLLIEKREGLTRSNRLYVQLLEGESMGEFADKVKTASSQERKPDFTTEGKRFAPNQSNPNQSYFSRFIPPRKTREKTVIAQQYDQREYTREQLNALFEVI